MSHDLNSDVHILIPKRDPISLFPLGAVEECGTVVVPQG